MIRSGIHLAESEEEKRAVYRMRYGVYVEEMGRYGSIADHENRLLFEPEDDTARIFYAAQDGEVVATARLSWGRDAPFSDRLIEHYRLQPFLDEVPREAMAIGERGMVVPRLRGTDVFSRLQAASRDFLAEHRVELVFGACEPHLLSLYIGQGFRTFAKQNINSPESGYLIPLVTVAEDVEYLRRIGSPIALVAKDFGADARIPDCVERLITNGGNVMSQRLTAAPDYWRQIEAAAQTLDEGGISALDGLGEEEAARCLGRSNLIACSPGDRVLKKGGVARNMFVVLEGALEARDEDRILRIMTAGDIFGEMAFLLEQPRSADVYAATSCRILSLSESTIRETIEKHPAVAANLLLNISKILCLRILKNG